MVARYSMLAGEFIYVLGSSSMCCAIPDSSSTKARKVSKIFLIRSKYQYPCVRACVCVFQPRTVDEK